MDQYFPGWREPVALAAMATVIDLIAVSVVGASLGPLAGYVAGIVFMLAAIPILWNYAFTSDKGDIGI